MATVGPGCSVEPMNHWLPEAVLLESEILIKTRWQKFSKLDGFPPSSAEDKSTQASEACTSAF